MCKTALRDRHTGKPHFLSFFSPPLPVSPPSPSSFSFSLPLLLLSSSFFSILLTFWFEKQKEIMMKATLPSREHQIFCQGLGANTHSRVFFCRSHCWTFAPPLIHLPSSQALFTQKWSTTFSALWWTPRTALWSDTTCSTPCPTLPTPWLAERLTSLCWTPSSSWRSSSWWRDSTTSSSGFERAGLGSSPEMFKIRESSGWDILLQTSVIPGLSSERKALRGGGWDGTRHSRCLHFRRVWESWIDGVKENRLCPNLSSRLESHSRCFLAKFGRNKETESLELVSPPS